MATSKARSRRPNHRATVEDSRDAKIPVRPTPPPPPAAPALIELTPSPDAGEAITLRQQASMMFVEDKQSHTEALEFMRGMKQLKRKIEDHWSRITRNVDDLKRNLLDLKRRDVEPLETAIDTLNGRIVTFVDAETRRQQEESDRRRREADEQARQKREKELADQEAEALRLEAQSPKLSAREELFVENYMRNGRAKEAAMVAKYASPAETGEKLLRTAKIIDAIASRRAADELRTQAAAAARQPVVVKAPERVESQLGRVAGTRMVTTYSAEVVDLDELITAVSLNRTLQKGSNGPLAANTVFLNQEATKYRESLESIYPGVRLIKRTTVAG